MQPCLSQNFCKLKIKFWNDKTVFFFLVFFKICQKTIQIANNSWPVGETDSVKKWKTRPQTMTTSQRPAVLGLLLSDFYGVSKKYSVNGLLFQLSGCPNCSKQYAPKRPHQQNGALRAPFLPAFFVAFCAVLRNFRFVILSVKNSYLQIWESYLQILESYLQKSSSPNFSRAFQLFQCRREAPARGWRPYGRVEQDSCTWSYWLDRQ